MDLPETLHGQLYLLAYDRTRRRFPPYTPVLGMALRAAVLTDLYLTGHLEDRDGTPHRTDFVDPSDPVLGETLEGFTRQGKWSEVIRRHPLSSRAVSKQLSATGWLRDEPRRVLGIFPQHRFEPTRPDTLDPLSAQVSEALRNAVVGLGAEPRPLALGLLGVNGQLPTVFSFDECAQHRQSLHDLTSCAIEPILGLREAVVDYLMEEHLNRVGG